MLRLQAAYAESLAAASEMGHDQLHKNTRHMTSDSQFGTMQTPCGILKTISFSPKRRTFVERELSNLADLIVERKEREGDTNQLYLQQPTIEEAFRTAFEAGIASDLDVEKAWKKFQKA
jgi:hypothetical protein